MKKALVIVLTLVLALSVVGLVSCAGKTYEGEYSYVNSRNEKQKYGCKVKVTVQGDVITNVEVLEDTADFFNLSAGWTSNYQESGVDKPGKTNWRKYGQAMAESFVGLTTKQVLGMKVYVNKVVNPGEPITGNENVETIKYIPEQLAVVVGGHGEIAKDAGATQSSARLILAVQDALLGNGGDASKNPNCVYMDPGQTVEGVYSYKSAYGSGSYGVKVKVTVKDGKITAVTVDPDTEELFNLSASWTEDYSPTGTPTAGKQNWMDHGADMAKSFVGLTVDAVKAITVRVSDSGEPVTSENTNDGKVAVNPFGNLPDGLVVIQQNVGNIAANAGATQSSGRLILAVQNALTKLK